MTATPGTWRVGGGTAIRGALVGALLIGAVIATSIDDRPAAAQHKGEPSPHVHDQTPCKYVPLHVGADKIPTLSVKLDPVAQKGGGGGDEGEDGDGGGGIAGSCPPITVAHTDSNFQSGTFYLQGGLVETEIAAATYNVPAGLFPIKLDLAEMIFCTKQAAVQTTTHWSILVWDGAPNTGILVAEYSSDGTILPHIVLPPGTTGVNVQVSVDPNDPDQIFIYNDSGQNRFTVGYRVDEHHNPPTSSCPCPGCSFCGTLPAVCCPPSPSSNAFPATDSSGLSQPSNNWIWGRNCPGTTGFCPTPVGWHTSGDVGISNDWVIRATYSPVNCAPPIGSCCLASGACLEGQSSAECGAQGGIYQGDGTACSTTNCPIATGACCRGNGNCTVETEADCIAMNGTFMGINAPCSANLCRGACCVPSSGNCVNNTTQNNCNLQNGEFQGFGVTCASVVCFPIGACCLPSGACAADQSPEQCAAQKGTFQGHNSTCVSVDCPVPYGACCVGDICLPDEPEENCVVGYRGTWQGPQSVCDPDPCAPGCPADIAPGSGDGAVNVQDLLSVIAHWGPCAGCPADMAPQPNGNDVVNVEDLLFVIANWGPC